MKAQTTDYQDENSIHIGILTTTSTIKLPKCMLSIEMCILWWKCMNCGELYIGINSLPIEAEFKAENYINRCVLFNAIIENKNRNEDEKMKKDNETHIKRIEKAIKENSRRKQQQKRTYKDIVKVRVTNALEKNKEQIRGNNKKVLYRLNKSERDKENKYNMDLVLNKETLTDEQIQQQAQKHIENTKSLIYEWGKRNNEILILSL